MVFDRQHTDGDGDGAGDEGAAFGCPAKVQEKDIDDTAGQTACGIDFLAEDEGHFVNKDITHDTATSTRDATQADGRPRGEPQSQGLLNTDDIEQREANTVKNKPGIVLAHQPLTEDENPYESEDARQQVNRIFEPERRFAYHQVADGATATRRGNAHDEGTKEVEVLGRGQTRTRDSTSERAHQLKNDKRPGDAQHGTRILKELLNDFHYLILI